LSSASGVNGKASVLTKSYLNDRYQRLRMNTTKIISDWDKVQQGVSQGLVVSPLFFLLHINDLPYIINNITKPILFANNTSIIFSNSDSIGYPPKFIAIFDKINVLFAIDSLS
jgi:hypothetical protein